MIELALLAIVATIFAGTLLAILFVASFRMLAVRSLAPEPVPQPDPVSPPPPQRKGALQRYMEMHG